MSLTSDDRHAGEAPPLPLFTAEGRRMPRDAMPGREIPPDLADMLTADLARAIALVDRHDRPVHTSETAGSFHH